VFTEQGNTWTEQQELQASDGALGDQFGSSVALNNDGHIALIGAPFKNSFRGAAYIFTEQNSAYAQQQELRASDGAPSDVFGHSVALNGDGHIALIGAPVKNGFQGAAYVFTEHDSTWTEQQELQASDGTSGDIFGSSVALNDDGRIALVGAPFKNSQKGAAYVFTERP
jgi:nucleoside-specific outer membrane channel protein Tsx